MQPHFYYQESGSSWWLQTHFHFPATQCLLCTMLRVLIVEGSEINSPECLIGLAHGILMNWGHRGGISKTSWGDDVRDCILGTLNIWINFKSYFEATRGRARLQSLKEKDFLVIEPLDSFSFGILRKVERRSQKQEGNGPWQALQFAAYLGSSN